MKVGNFIDYFIFLRFTKKLHRQENKWTLFAESTRDLSY